VTVDAKSLAPRPANGQDIVFAEGIPGFEWLRRAKLTWDPQIRPFFSLEAVAPRGLAVVCVEPTLAMPDYDLTIPEALVHALDLHGPCDVWLFSLVTLAERREDLQANLMCPVVVNVRTCRAGQLIRDDALDLLRYRLWQPDQAEIAMEQVG